MHVLLTRPREDSERLAADLRACGHRVTLAPMLLIRPLGGGAIDVAGAQAILFTSVNGVRTGAARLSRRDRPVFAVGDRTAQAARRAGFADVRSADGDAGDLAALIAKTLTPQDGPLLHMAGADVGDRLADAARKAGFGLQREIVYEAAPAQTLPADAAKAIDEGDIDLVLLYSPRTARRFVELAGPDAIARVHAGMLSAAVADAALKAAGGARFKGVTVAPAPNQAALLEALTRQMGQALTA